LHGGLSPYVVYLDHIRTIDRVGEIPPQGPLCDITWSDPDTRVEEFESSPRGSGYQFGNKVAAQFLHINGLTQIIRSHQLVQKGYEYVFPDKSVLTVWSAPNYCYRCGNVASVLTIGENMGKTFDLFASVSDSSKAVPYKNIVPYFL